MLEVLEVLEERKSINMSHLALCFVVLFLPYDTRKTIFLIAVLLTNKLGSFTECLQVAFDPL